MKETLAGRTRWRRFAIAMVPAVAGAAALIVASGTGAIASSFAMSGTDFQVSAQSMHVDGFAQYGSVDHTQSGTDADGKPVPTKFQVVAVAAAQHALVKGLCQSVVTDVKIPGVGSLGKFTMKIEAGGAGSDPVEATNLFLDMTQLHGNAVFKNIEIGRDASTLDKGAGKGQLGGFGQQADTADIANVEQVAYSVNAGTFALNGMHLTVQSGERNCFTPHVIS